MEMTMKGWRKDKLKLVITALWLLTVFFGFFGSTVLLIKLPGLPALYPFRILAILVAKMDYVKNLFQSSPVPN